MSIYVAALAASLGLFTVIFAVAYSQKNYHFINAFWPLGFIAVAMVALIWRLDGRVLGVQAFSVSGCGEQPLRFTDACTTRVATPLSAEPSTYWPALLVSGLVAIWGVRLCWHILKRNRTRSGRVKHHITHAHKWPLPRRFVQLAASEALLLWIISLPLVFLFTISFDEGSYADSLLLGPFAIGVALWLAGFAYEVIADRQLHAFTANPANKGKVLMSGLWKYSRHPNYFGEALMWWGIFVCTLVAYEPRLWLIISPLLLTYMLRFVSGVPVLEKKHADNKAYQAYARRTHAMFPWPPRRG